jgi:cell division septal protein FtsQ
MIAAAAEARKAGSRPRLNARAKLAILRLVWALTIMGMTLLFFGLVELLDFFALKRAF